MRIEKESPGMGSLWSLIDGLRELLGLANNEGGGRGFSVGRVHHFLFVGFSATINLDGSGVLEHVGCS